MLLLLPLSAAAGSCSAGNRVDHRNAECLYAWWNNRGLLRKSPYHVSNQCYQYGKVVAKVDLVSASDRTIHLTDALPRDGDTRHRIRGISCCSDLGICNRSDAVTDEGCRTQFRRVSSASMTCGAVTASAAISGDDYSCTVTATCAPEFSILNSSSVTVPFVALGNVNNCNGRLRPGPCRSDPPDTAGVSVFDAAAFTEYPIPDPEPFHTLRFKVFLSRMLPVPVTVDYATSDGTAQAGQDYVAASGTLTFRPGETGKSVAVRVLKDGHDEGEERMTLTLSNLRPSSRVQMQDATATGTIHNTDPMPKAWIGRFGRTVADQVLDAVDHRMRAKPAPGIEAHVAGQRIGPGPAFAAGPQGYPMSSEAEASGLGQPMSERDLLPGSSFSLTAETGGKGLVSVWGRGAATGFSSREDDVSFDGEVASGLLGADWTRGDWTAGLAVSHSRGDGAYRGAGGGTVSATLTGLWPWVGHSLGERLSVWGVAGYGDGSLTLEPRAEDGTHAGAIRTDLDLRMAAAGLRGVALDGGEDGLTLAVKADAMAVRTASDAASGPGGNLAAAEAGVTRLRLGLEGSRPFRLAGGSVLTPAMEIALRRDGGDAETGFGAEIGAGIAWRDSGRGLGAELRGRGLLAHEAKGFRLAGLAASVSWEPVAGGRGPRLSLTQASGVPGRDAFDAPAGTGPANDDRDRRLEARFGYGLPAFGGRFTATPEIAVGISAAGRDYVLGWRLAGGGAPDGSALELGVEARRRESASGRSEAAEHALGVRLISLF
ncbi:MAG: hypothetical protein OXE57_16005 [Alphaproteobacteria bacterium]|nr:hypothetical protein [Alphaproteobacteria bacterium]